MTSEIYTTDILDKEHFWTEELMKVNEDFLFGCSTGVWGRGWGERKGIVELHAYSVLKAREIDGVRLVLLKNPWGKHEWKGPWSDGSKEWTAEWLHKLDHKFGDDGSFWISYDDLLKKYQAFDRTRLFGPEWKVASIWTTLNVSWTLDYHDTKFAFSLAKSGPVVIVFAQLDERYFKGLEGQYRFELGFRVHKAGEEDYVVRSQNYYRMNRSVNVELDLEAGEYVVVVKIDAQRNECVMPVEEVVRTHAKERREKLLRVGFAYDVAHSKGKIIETDEEKAAREAYDKRKKDSDRRKLAKAIKNAKMAAKKKEWRDSMKKRNRALERRAKAKAKAERRAAKRRAKAEDSIEKNENQDGEDKVIVVSMDKSEKEGGNEGQTEDSPATIEDKSEVTQNEKSVAGHGASEISKTEDTTPLSKVTDEKHVKIEAADITSTHAEGSVSSTDAGAGTPASSTVFEKTPAPDDDVQEGDDKYVTAAEEDDGEKGNQSTKPQQTADEGDGPDTPKVAQSSPEITGDRPTAKPTATSSTQPAVDVGVQTEPGLLPPPPPPPLPTSTRKHRSRDVYVSTSSYPAPPGASYLYSRPPIRDLSQIPPHLRAAYATAYNRAPSDISDLSVDSDASDESDSLSDVSEVSDDDIEAILQNAEATQAARAEAAAQVAGKSGPPANETRTEEDLVMDEFERDPWNAVGVFGLRVYYKVAMDGKNGESGEGEGEQEVVRLRVERPNPYVWDESDDDGDEDDAGDQADDEQEEGTEETKVLDVDDSAKDAVGEKADVGTVDEKKECVKEEEAGEGKEAENEAVEEKRQDEKNEEHDKTEKGTENHGKENTDEKEIDGKVTTKGDGEVNDNDAAAADADRNNEGSKKAPKGSLNEDEKTVDEPKADKVIEAKTEGTT